MTPKKSLANKEATALVNPGRLPEILAKKFLALKDLKRPACGVPETTQYLRSLSMKGDFEACALYVEMCLGGGSQLVVPALLHGARCAIGLNQFDRAHKFYSEMNKQSDYRGENLSAALVEFAYFAHYTVYPEQTEAIIHSHPTWSAQQKLLAMGLVNYMGETDLKDVTKEEVRAFLDDELKNASGYYASLIKGYRIALADIDYDYPKALKHLVEDAAAIENPMDLWEAGFPVLYRTSASSNFKVAKAFYDAFVPYGHARSFLPVEMNIFNYSEIQNQVCKNNLSTPADRSRLEKDVKLWRAGSLSFDSMLSKVKLQLEKAPKSDLHVVYGSLLAIQGEWEKAREQYWQGHQLCVYNNRAHWGLALVKRQEKYRAYPEFEQIEAQIEQDVQRVVFPAEISTYIVNWKAFPENSQKLIRHGLRFYAPYLRQMKAGQYTTYVKLPFELLSDSPTMASLRDTRIGGSNYKFDNRLWDDVRGAGGNTVVADHDEVMQTPHGAYNLMVHEVAHQFHRYLENNRGALGRCIEDLYAAAKKRNVFPDGYAASNKEEYFAQGVTYHMIPTDSPARYGLNGSWLQPNDPDLLKFIQSIEAADGSVAKIACPI